MEVGGRLSLSSGCIFKLDRDGMGKPVWGFDRPAGRLRLKALGSSFGAAALALALAPSARTARADEAPSLIFFGASWCHACHSVIPSVAEAAGRLPPGHVTYVTLVDRGLVTAGHILSSDEAEAVEDAMANGTPLPAGVSTYSGTRPPSTPFLIARHSGRTDMAGGSDGVPPLLAIAVPPGRNFRPAAVRASSASSGPGGSRGHPGHRRSPRPSPSPRPLTVSELNECGIYNDDELPTRLAANETEWRALLPPASARPAACSSRADAFERGFREGLSGQRFIMSMSATTELWEEEPYASVDADDEVAGRTCGSIWGSGIPGAVGGTPSGTPAPSAHSASVAPGPRTRTFVRAFSPQRADRQACQPYRSSPDQAAALDCCIQGFTRAMPHLASYLRDSPDRDSCTVPPAGREGDTSWTPPSPDSPLCTTNSCRSAFTFGIFHARGVCRLQADPSSGCYGPPLGESSRGRKNIRYLGCFHLGFLTAQGECSGTSAFTRWLAANSSAISGRVVTGIRSELGLDGATSSGSPSALSADDRGPGP